jgi:hypothetical protein
MGTGTGAKMGPLGTSAGGDRGSVGAGPLSGGEPPSEGAGPVSGGELSGAVPAGGEPGAAAGGTTAGACGAAGPAPEPGSPAGAGPLPGALTTGGEPGATAGGTTPGAGGAAGAGVLEITVAGLGWPAVESMTKPSTAPAPMAPTTAAASTAVLRTGHRVAAGAIGSGGNSKGSERYPSSSAVGSPSGLDAHAGTGLLGCLVARASPSAVVTETRCAATEFIGVTND